ncbi:Rgg/GadR/MutR family transcriptional regulator [Streptococcus sp. S784/96/1]|uniref:Rgg/GadR/MutR family transcriptional regulator n=1 Tax=Streptococcus sp. S784/96/1 TaxID=2653499 RepID=UPI001386B877|nr:Rgg/GadR/MutR family transcriptional regulator [Streptococcus sp. S784/96/1]
MTHYGDIFRTFRLDRQMKLSQVAGDGLSVSQLSRFERGESDLSVTKFFDALEKINVTPDEFMGQVNHYERAEQIKLMSQLARAHYRKDIKRLEQIVVDEENKVLADQENKVARLNAILFRGMICDLNPSRQMRQEDLDQVSDHLFCTENWTIFELILIGNLFKFYETSYMYRLVDEVLQRKELYQDIATHRNLIEATLLNVIEICIDRGDLTAAKHYHDKLMPMLDNERNAYHRILQLYFKGLLAYASGDKTGEQQMRQVVQIFDWIGATYHQETYQEHLKRQLEKYSHIYK